MTHLTHHMRTSILTVALLTASTASAQDISYQQAVATATDFFESHGLEVSPSAMRRAKGARAADNGNSPYYIINAGEAFAVVAGDSRVTPILAYSLEGNFDEGDTPPAAAYLLDMYEDYIRALNAGEVQPAPRRLPALSQDKVLVTATWHQGWEPWWDKCPMESEYRHCWAGCVATAMGIIMRYHCWPQTTGYGSKTYTTTLHNFVCSADFGATDYRISTIPLNGADLEALDCPEEHKDAIATLLYHAGVAASMEYDGAGSGTSDMNAFTGICRYFGYKYGGWAVRMNYSSDDDYLRQIVAEIDAGRPMLYSGIDYSDGGHMFVCDGYDTDYRLHFNFGWKGNRNGFYSIIDTDMTYYKGQSAIIGIEPNPDAATAIHPWLYFAETGDKVQTMVVNARVGNTTLNLGVNRIYNMTEGQLSCDLKYYICDAEGNPKAALSTGSGDTDYISLKYNYIGTLSRYVYLPSSYTYVPGDNLRLYYHDTDCDQWLEVKRYQESNALDLALLYDPKCADLKMWDNSGNCPGLNPVGTVKADGSQFKMRIGNIFNYTWVQFDGDVAIWLCDSDDNPKQMAGSTQGYSLYFNAYRETCDINCTIDPDWRLDPGDRLVAFCRPTGSEVWSMMDCDDHSKYYVEIPDALIPTVQQVAFDGMFATRCSVYDLDYSGITDYGAYTISLQDSETLVLTRVNNVAAGVGVLLMGNNGSSAYSAAAPILRTPTAAPASNLLIGVLEDTIVDNDSSDPGANFVFKTSPDIGFYLAQGENLPGRSAYLRLPAKGAGAPARFVFMTGTQSGVFSVSADVPSDPIIYNLQGMPVTHPTPGLYIISGKKVIIR